jgi:hypothetical protein
MPRLSPVEIEEFLARPLACRLGCLDDEGHPYVVPISHYYEDGKIYFFAREKALWAGYLLRDPRVFLCIDASNLEEEQWNKRVQIRGTVTLVAGPQAPVYPPPPGDLMSELGLRWEMRVRGLLEDEADKSAAAYHRGERYLWFVVNVERMTSWWGDWAQRYTRTTPDAELT